jgi:hypothetical protein
VKGARFEYQKGLNIEKVEQMRAMEQNLTGMAREMEKLHIDVLNADNRARGNFFLHLNVVVISFTIFFHIL